MARAAGEAGIPIRVGVNAGSLDKELLESFGAPVPEALVESALREVRYLEDVGFYDIKISVKHSHVPSMVEAYRLLAEKVEYPLHLGVTEAGPPPGGLIKSVAGIGTLLLEGIGDTIRFSLTADPVEEAKAGRGLLEYLGLRERRGLDLIACPSCGRAEVDVIGVAAAAQKALEAEQIPIQVAVMGCVVNGPGEARGRSRDRRRPRQGPPVCQGSSGEGGPGGGHGHRPCRGGPPPRRGRGRGEAGRG